MLSEATFDQLVELPGVGPTRAQQFLQLREEAGGKLQGLGYATLGEYIWRVWPIHEQFISMVRVKKWACWAEWERMVFWNWT